jgi:hypothetical protein
LYDLKKNKERCKIRLDIKERRMLYEANKYDHYDEKELEKVKRFLEMF